MDKTSTLLLIIPIFLIVECGSKKETAQNNENPSAKDTSIVMTSDTIPQPPPPPPGLAPGQAKIRGEVISHDNEIKSTLSLRIEKVLGYGPATPPIAVNDTLVVHLTAQSQNEINIGKIVSAVISYRQQLDDSKSTPLWTFVSFEEDPN